MNTLIINRICFFFVEQHIYMPGAGEISSAFNPEFKSIHAIDLRHQDLCFCSILTGDRKQ